MHFHPGPEWYMAYHELDPLKDNRCIYYTQNEKRCRRLSGDNTRAIELHKLIGKLSPGTVNLDLVIEYILCCCCISGRARHRNRVEDRHELIPLAERWLGEIQRHATVKTIFINPFFVSALHENDSYSYDTGTSQSSNPDYSNISSTTPTSKAASFGYTESIFAIDGAPSRPFVDSSPKHSGLDVVDSIVGSFDRDTPYNLRSCKINTSAASTLSLASTYRAPLSEFAPHVTVTEPWDKVSQKLLKPLIPLEGRIGSLYIFDRPTSPGHVKIGYTARSVADRLAEWFEECGYAPRLRFEAKNVPYVRRAETLVHHELIKEWRRERRCNHGKGCAKAHQEWFEISTERAFELVGHWADFMKRAKPYDSTGHLKPQWMKFVQSLDAKQEVVTVKKLLAHLEVSPIDNRNLAENLAAWDIEQKKNENNEPKIEDFKPASSPRTHHSSKSVHNLPERLMSTLAVEPEPQPSQYAKANVSHDASETKKILVEENVPEQISKPPSPLLKSTAGADEITPVDTIGETLSATNDENEKEAELNAMALRTIKIEDLSQSSTGTQLSEMLTNSPVQVQKSRKTSSLSSGCPPKEVDVLQSDAQTELDNEDYTIPANKEHKNQTEDPKLATKGQILSIEPAPSRIIDEFFFESRPEKSDEIGKVWLL